MAALDAERYLSSKELSSDVVETNNVSYSGLKSSA
jgi:hypothetical protein